MADMHEGADKKAHPPAPGPPGPLSYARVFTGPERVSEDEGINGGSMAESLGPTEPEDP